MNRKLALSSVLHLCVPIMASDTSVTTSTRLFTEISAEHRKNAQRNFVFSPYSILGVFHMAQLGADGETKKEMDTLVSPDEDFKLPSFGYRTGYEEDERVKLETANRIYVSSSLEGNEQLTNFNKEVESAIGSDARTVDFGNASAAAEEMNKYVKEKTHGHITDLIDSSTLSQGTKVVLLNAMYFKAPWNSPFQKGATAEGVFYGETADGVKEQRVSFMRQRMDDGIAVLQETEVTAFSMGYSDYRLHMYVYMPRDMKAFESKIAAQPEAMEALAARVKEAAESNVQLILEIPKFKLGAKSNSVNLVDLFRRLGARRMFDPADADFSGMTGKRELFVSSYVHQADIDVDEEGTEATAATAMGVMLTSMPMLKKTVHVVVDRPFLFQVRLEEQGRAPRVLFYGRISDAQAAQ